jgi:hypothetical protein
MATGPRVRRCRRRPPRRRKPTCRSGGPMTNMTGRRGRFGGERKVERGPSARAGLSIAIAEGNPRRLFARTPRTCFPRLAASHPSPSRGRVLARRRSRARVGWGLTLFKALTPPGRSLSLASTLSEAGEGSPLRHRG